MKKTLIGAAAVALGLTGALAFVTAASAAPTTDCKSVTVNLTDRNDTGTGGGVWAKDTMARTLKVCVEAAEPAVAAETTWKYSATVTDAGTFTTVEGVSPKANVPLAAGINGTVNGGFTSTVFTAPAWDKTFELKAPPAATTSSNWVSEAFPGSEGATISSYKWTYKTACETYIDNNGTYKDDITSKCVTPKAPIVTKATCEKAGELVIPQVVGVKYMTTTKENGKVVVTAKAKPGYVLTPQEGGWEWKLTIPGQLTGDVCKEPTTTPPTPAATPTPTPSQSTAAPVPSESESTPVGAQLPVTGPGGGTNVPLIGGLAGGALLAFGIALFAWAKRRRDNEVEFTA